MKKPLLSLLLIITSHLLFAQTFVGVSSAPADNAAQAGPNSPALTPPVGMLAGDLVVIHGQYRATGATFSINQAGGQTWNTIAGSNASNQTTAIFWCTYNGTWGASPSIKVASGTNGLTAVMYVFRPTALGFSWRVNNTLVTGTTTGTNPNTVNGVTTTASNTVAMAFWSSAFANTWGTLGGTGWLKTGLAAQYRNTTTGQSHTAAYNIQTTAFGATNNATQNETGTTTAAVTGIISWNQVPDNDNCANATLITTGPACVAGTSSFTNQTLNGANADGGTITSNCSAVNNPDVWYKFVAQSKYPTITINNLGANWGTRLKIQLLSGSCGSFTEVTCANNTLPASSLPIMPPGNGLAIGNTYYIRIQKNNAGTPTGGPASWAFDICVADLAGSTSGRMNEVFKQTILSGPNLIADPWEITYGPDDSLWITESKGYKVYRMDPVSGAKTTVLDISQGSTFLPLADQIFNCQFNNGSGVQGGLAGLALHPKFLAPVGAVNYAYVSYVYKQDSASAANASCTFWKNRLVRFTFNTTTKKFESPVSLCDTLPGGNDHNSQRMIIAPVGGTYYLFYASGDLGAGQLACRLRVQNAQNINSYEGKILRFNLDTDNDNGTLTALNNWIPNNNPYNVMLGKQSAVWATGIRNNQGLAYDTALNILYGSSHGPYSDDEINIIQPFTNYGHPLVIGYASDENYSGTNTPGANTNVSAGAPFTDNNGVSANPSIVSEMTNRATINAAGKGTYKDPLFSAYAPLNGDILTPGTVKYIWKNNPNNATPAPGWPSEAWSGLDLYTNTLIPGWKKSLVAASLKWGRLVRIKLGTSGTITMPSNDPINNAGDTISYFGSQNRFRDLAFAPNGKDIYVVMDRSTTTSGPSAQFPVIPSCLGCVQKYTFLGYADNGGKSTIPAAIDVTNGTTNTPNPGTTITIDASNNNIWVPITGPDGNIMAEINAMGQNLGVVTSSFYQNSGPIRQKNGFHYLDRNITITPAVTTFGTPVKIRLYISKAEFNALDADPSSGITAGISQLKILKNEDPIGAAIVSSTVDIPVTITGTDLVHGANGYVLQGQVSDFSSFFFAATNITLPLELVYFKGALQNNATLLQWQTANETNTSHFDVERSVDGRVYSAIGTVTANGTGGNKYAYKDYDVNNLSSAVIYYRLKMVDADGKYTYSNVVTIYLSDITGLSVSPNPTSGETKMTINAAVDGRVQWKLRDNNGKVVMQNTIGVTKGNNNVTINISRLSIGLYYLHVEGAGVDQHIKLQKL
ncbi:MAG: PQQ-dependent sugar dehydrogenase [Chitinophagaceae bacterium]